MHEITHAMIYAAWRRRGPIRAKYRANARALDEIVADILPAVYLGKSGHHAVKDGFARDMARPNRPSVAEAIAKGESSHDVGDSLRLLFWSASNRIGPAAFFRAIGGEIGTSYEEMPDRPRRTSMELFQDPQFEWATTNFLNWELTAKFARRLAARIPQVISIEDVNTALGELECASLLGIMPPVSPKEVRICDASDDATRTKP